jgi:hypothetical protein
MVRHQAEAEDINQWLRFWLSQERLSFSFVGGKKVGKAPTLSFVAVVLEGK